MKSDRLDEELRAHYQGKRPSERLLGRMREVAELEDATRNRRGQGYLLSAAVAATLAFVFWSSGWASPSPGTLQEATLRAVAKEIALNHEGHYAPDIPGTELTTIVAALDRLDFVPILPAQTADLALVGARYCSLQGHIAAQFQLEDASGKRFTLYEARHGERIGELSPTRLDVGTTHVQIWTEDDLVFGLAFTPSAKPRAPQPSAR